MHSEKITKKISAGERGCWPAPRLVEKGEDSLLVLSANIFPNDIKYVHASNPQSTNIFTENSYFQISWYKILLRMLLICKELLLPQLAFVVRTVSPCSGMEPQDKSLRCHDIISLLGSNDHFTCNCSCSVYKEEWRLSVKTLLNYVHYWTLLKCNKEDCQQMWQNIWERYYLGNMGEGK